MHFKGKLNRFDFLQFASSQVPLVQNMVKRPYPSVFLSYTNKQLLMEIAYDRNHMHDRAAVVDIKVMVSNPVAALNFSG